MSRIYNRYSKRKNKYTTPLNKYAAIIILLLVGFYVIWFWNVNFDLPFRLDQQASTIAGIVIGVIGSMFGLTAASYAFIWGEVKNEGERNSRLECILECYREKLWLLFVNTLILTFSIVIFNLIILGLIQNITDSTLFYEHSGEINGSDVIITSYLNENNSKITLLIIADLYLSIISIVFMGNLNYNVFNRSRYYRNIAKEILENLQKDYDLSLPDNFKNKEEWEKNEKYLLSDELNKIRYLELLISRILKNHESEEFEAYHQKNNDKQFIDRIIYSKLNNIIYTWDHLKQEKFIDLKKKCDDKAKEELKIIKEQIDFEKPYHPTSVGFAQAYSDLILYHNAKLVYENRNINGVMLKCTIKKRLLLFYMSHEKFDGMDLSNISLSGADLSYSNFSNCNLKGVRLKGTNCKGTDFSHSLMPGIHFSDMEEVLPENIQKNDIEITQCDDNLNRWDIYNGHQATCLESASFSNADVSRMTLISYGEIDQNDNFPFSSTEVPVIDKILPFSMREVNFDDATLFKSMFKNVDLKNSSFFQARMYNSNLTLVHSSNVNFEKTVLTYSIIKYSSFINSNFQKTVMSNCYIYRGDFSYANLSDANFSNSKIIASKFYNSICNNTSFKNIIQDHIESTDKGTNIISFEYATIIGADFSNSKLIKSDFSHSNAKNCIFTKVHINNSIFLYTILHSTIWNSSKIVNTKFIGSVMRDCMFISVDFIGCTFRNSDFSESIVNSRFIGGKMMDVKFCNVKELNPKLFNRITLSRVDFTGCGVTEKDFSSSVNLYNCVFDAKKKEM